MNLNHPYRNTNHPDSGLAGQRPQPYRAVIDDLRAETPPPDEADDLEDEDEDDDEFEDGDDEDAEDEDETETGETEEPE